ncbi:hypothetical protein PHYSODRAFT_336792 [Phytophthora sojae]|uniref:RxLR effector protein n=1 Tax=Phytophthora sojae (strain P6497) TaxID=1094619 RepID=G4ZWE0_PHYSP|nr:hypothetical protein PHYSODRAFT_336792 [Phytophthora sojae]EGZ12368.1 hypothetical protein PHYSODRAFT_336792 [Phytophthora sojae]|eukprot:XP_009532701.1 hypothetical protein PHYSODRAFT_336792 [Phytophthora sojae]
MSLEKALTHLDLDKIAKVDKVDDFVTSPKLNQWIGHMADTNRHASSKKDAMTITKFLVSQRGDDEVVKLLSAARASDNKAVRKLGYKLQFDQFKLWIKAGKEPSQLRKEVPALSKRMRTAYRQEYENALAKAAAAAEKANEKVRASADIIFVKP